MRDQVVMAPSGHLCIAIPLYRWHHEEPLARLEGYTVSLTNGKPLAYVVDAGPEAGSPRLFNAQIIEDNFEFLGDIDG